MTVTLALPSKGRLKEQALEVLARAGLPATLPQDERTYRARIEGRSDIEVVFLYPWAVHFDELKVFGLIEMVLFIATVFVAYAYVWRRGGLDWD